MTLQGPHCSVACAGRLYSRITGVPGVWQTGWCHSQPSISIFSKDTSPEGRGAVSDDVLSPSEQAALVGEPYFSVWAHSAAETMALCWDGCLLG